MTKSTAIICSHSLWYFNTISCLSSACLLLFKINLLFEAQFGRDKRQFLRLLSVKADSLTVVLVWIFKKFFSIKWSNRLLRFLFHSFLQGLILSQAINVLSGGVFHQFIIWWVVYGFILGSSLINLIFVDCYYLPRVNFEFDCSFNDTGIVLQHLLIITIDLIRFHNVASVM